MVTVYIRWRYSLLLSQKVMYPNSICSFNIFAATMIGKLFIDGGDELKTYDEDAGKEYVEDMIAKDINHLGHKWYGLPNYEDLVAEIISGLKLAAVA